MNNKVIISFGPKPRSSYHFTVAFPLLAYASPSAPFRKESVVCGQAELQPEPGEPARLGRGSPEEKDGGGKKPSFLYLVCRLLPIKSESCLSTSAVFPRSHTAAATFCSAVMRPGVTSLETSSKSPGPATVPSWPCGFLVGSVTKNL